MWHIPGETVEEGESDERALIRGMKEETGLDIKVCRYICSSITPTSRKDARWYECSSETDNAKPRSDLEELKWVPKKEVLSLCRNENGLLPPEIFHYFSG